MTYTIVAHRSELAQPGDYVLLSGEEPMLAYNHDGEIVVTDNLCPHRGSKIMDGTHGCKPMKCPYHGWEAKAIIGQGRRYLTAWLGDWLCAGDGSVSFVAQFDGIAHVLTEIGEHVTRRMSFESMPMSCHWTTAVENTLEDLHVPSVHPDTFQKLDLRLEEMHPFGRNSGASYTIGDARTVKSLESLSKHFTDVRPNEYSHLFIYPYTCLSSVGGFSYSLQHYVPSGGWTSFHTRLYAGKMREGAPDLSWFYAEATDFNRRVFQQDAAVCARVVGSGTVLTESERRVAWFREA